jgi:hypothetical protein
MITNLQMIYLLYAETLIEPKDVDIKFTDRQPRIAAAPVNTLTLSVLGF